MRIIIEEYKYPAEKANDILEGISNLRDINGTISVSYVGYFYNPTLKDCVFVLPKVLLNEQGLAFGKYLPEDIIDLDEKNNPLTPDEYRFVYELGVWIYRAITVFRDATGSDIVKQQQAQQMTKGRLHKCHTFLDVIFAIQKFNRENQDFFFFTLRNIHSGFNKINWNRTISKSTAFLQDGDAVYLDLVNKKRQINFDEELLIIFFSILKYINSAYGFPVLINVNFPLITDNKFEAYRNGMGKARLMQIKYKYFSDKALYLWDLCYAFFDLSKDINIETDNKEYLLVKDFNIVFEAIIDELIGDKIPENEKRLKTLKEQADGKLIDHIYRYQELTSNKDDKPVYYIGDSKYYKSDTPIGTNSIAKQFTYARNVIQWNLDLFKDGTEEERKGHQKLRDDVTEGYNVIPNFFISAQQKNLKREDDIKLTDKNNKDFMSLQFENRLYDRDTFLIAHYDVNFLFVIGLYGKNNTSEKTAWKNKIRAMFRKEIQMMLQSKFDFHVMTPHPDVNASAYIQEHFQQLLGKVFTPYKNDGVQRYYSLALNKDAEFTDENEALISQLNQAFYVRKIKNMSDDPSEVLADVVNDYPSVVSIAPPSDYLTLHWLEKYKENSVVIGCYRNEEHLKWILGANDRGSLIYNLRLGKVKGGQVKAQLDRMVVSFAILYEYGHENENKYRVFRVHHHATMTAQRMKQSGYPGNPSAEKYFCYVFDEEVSLGNIDIHSLISTVRIDDHSYEDGAPIFKTCKEMIGFRKVE